MGIYHNIISMKAHIQEITNGQIECLAEEYTGIDQIIPCRCTVCGYEFRSRVRSFYNKNTKDRNHCPNCRYEQVKSDSYIREPATEPDGKHHIVYKITNKITGKYYIGKHSTQNINDSYMGSGRGIKNAIKKYGRDNFIKEILYDFTTEKEAFDKEAEIVTPEVVANPLTYNQYVGGYGTPTGDKHPMYGLAHSPKTIEASVGRKNKCTCLVGGRRPPKVTQELKDKILELYVTEKSIQKIAVQVELSEPTVRKFLKEAGVYVYIDKTVKNKDELVQYKIDHPEVSQKALAKMFNTTQGTVAQILRTNGIVSWKHRAWKPEEQLEMIEYTLELNKTMTLVDAMKATKEKYGISTDTLEKQIHKYRKNNNQLGNTNFLSIEKVKEFIEAVVANNGEQVKTIGSRCGISENSALKYWNRHKAEYGF